MNKNFVWNNWSLIALFIFTFIVLPWGLLQVAKITSDNNDKEVYQKEISHYFDEQTSLGESNSLAFAKIGEITGNNPTSVFYSEGKIFKIKIQTDIIQENYKKAKTIYVPEDDVLKEINNLFLKGMECHADAANNMQKGLDVASSELLLLSMKKIEEGDRFWRDTGDLMEGSRDYFFK